MTGVHKNNSFILTKTGWKSLEDFMLGEVLIGTDIFSFNIKEGKEEWTPLLGINTTNDNIIYKINFNNKKEILVSPDCLWITDLDHTLLDDYIKGNLPDNETRLLKTEDLIPFFSTRTSHGSSMFLHKLKVRLNPINFSIGMRFNTNDPYIDTSNITFIKLRQRYDTWSPITLNSTFICKYNNSIFVLGCYPDSKMESNGITLQPLFLTNYNINNPIPIPRVKAHSSAGSINKIIILERPPEFLQLKNNGSIINTYPAEIDYNYNLEIIFLEEFQGKIVIPYNVKDIRNNSSLIPSTITISTLHPSFNTTPEHNIDYNLLNQLYQTLDKKNRENGYVGLDSERKIDPDFVDINSFSWSELNNNSLNTIYYSLFNSLTPQDWNIINDNINLNDNNLNISWNDIRNIPEEFIPTTHNHTWNEILEIPNNILFINNDISLLNNDIGYITELDINSNKNKFNLTGSISNSISYITLSNSNFNNLSNFIIENNSLKIIESGNYFIDINLQLPIINPGYSYLTKYNLGILINNISYNIYFSSINSELIDLIDFNRQLFLEIPSNSFLYFTIKLEEEEENNYQLNINNSPSSNFITIYK